MRWQRDVPAGAVWSLRLRQVGRWGRGDRWQAELRNESMHVLRTQYTLTRWGARRWAARTIQRFERRAPEEYWSPRDPGQLYTTKEET